MNSKFNENIMQLDINAGGGIISESIRVDTIDNPILVIGLGGTGIDAMLRLKYQINRRFKLPENAITKRRDDKPNNIEFIGFETNINDKTKAYPGKGGISLDPNNELVLLSNANIGAVLKNRKLMDHCVKEWLSPEINAADGTNGAGGCRQIGRLLMFYKITEVVQSLRKKINTIMQGTNEKLLVLILSGISGGTGSGCFLDIPYIIRGIMNEKFSTQGDDKLRIFGYMFTPDVNIAKVGLNEHTKDYIMKNGYAALKELDYWMNVQERKEKFHQKYMNVIEVNSGFPPYDMCHLVSATNMEGVILKDAYDYCMNVTAENIVHFIASEKKVNDEYAFMDYSSNIDSLIRGMEKPYNANYKYSVIGASCAVLPIEDITTFIAYKLFHKMNNMFQATPQSNDVREFINALGLDEESLSRKFETGVREPLAGYENSSRFSFDNLFKNQSVSVDQELKEYLESAGGEYSKVRNDYPPEMTREFKKHIDRIFQDPQKGPFYASRLIFSDGNIDTISELSSTKAKLESDLAVIKQRYDDLSKAAQDRFYEAKAVKLLGKDKKKNEYLAAKKDEYLKRADYLKARKMIEYYDEIIYEFNSLNLKIYGVYKEILNKLSEIFENNGRILLNKGEKTTKSGSTYYWNVVNVDDINKTIDNVVNSLKTDSLLMDFSARLVTESEMWINEDEVDITNSVSSFITDKFGGLIGKSMEEFLNIKYGENKPIDKLLEFEIAPKLNQNAVPVFHLNNSSYNLSLPSWGLVSIPEGTPDIKSGIENYQQKSANGRSNFTIKISQVKNKIFWLNTKNGLPLYAYSPLSQYETKYEETIFKHEGIGRHLVQNDNENWAYLPSPIPENAWPEEYDNKRVKEYNNSLREFFNKALNYGCIRQKSADNRLSAQFEVVKTESFDIKPLYEKKGINLSKDKTLNFEKLNSFYNELNKLKDNGINKVETFDIFSSSDVEVAKSNFIRSPKLVEIIRDEVLKYDSISQEISKIEKIKNTAQKNEELFNNYIHILLTDTILKKGLFYLYDQGEEEKGEWEPFVNLMDNSKFTEFHAYKKFISLDDEQLGIIVKKAQDRFTKISTDTEKIKNKVESLHGVYSEYVSQLKEKKSEMINGEEIYGFYKKLFEKIDEIKKML